MKLTTAASVFSALVLSTMVASADEQGIAYMKRYADALATVDEKGTSKIPCDSGALKSRNAEVASASDCLKLKTEQIVGEHLNFHWEKYWRVVTYNSNSYFASHIALKSAGGYEWTKEFKKYVALDTLGMGSGERIDDLEDSKPLKVSFLNKYNMARGTAEKGKYQCLLAYAKRGKTSALTALTCSREEPSAQDMKTVLKAIQ